LTVSVPLVAILGAVVFVACRYMGMRVWQAILCSLFGFFIAATRAAPEIRNLVTAIVKGLTSSEP
jgi:dolichyl-phosphate-mannose--protein O-mannosyl transferase